MLRRHLFIMMSTETCLQVRDHKMALTVKVECNEKHVFSLIFYRFSWIYSLFYLIFTLLCTVFYTKCHNSERSPICRGNWSRWKIRIFQIEIFYLKKWCLRCPGKVPKHCQRAHRARNRILDFFVHYISVIRYGPTCSAREGGLAWVYLHWLYGFPESLGKQKQHC